MSTASMSRIQPQNAQMAVLLAFGASRRAFIPVGGDTLQFGLSLPNLRKTTLPYARLDPWLTEKEIADYHRAEEEWHNLLTGLKPNAEGFDELLKRVQAQPDMVVKFTRSRGHSGGTSERDDGKIVITIGDPEPDFADGPPLDKSVGMKTLAHELLHALHHRYTTWQEETATREEIQAGYAAYRELGSPPYFRFLNAGRYRNKVRETIETLPLTELKILRECLFSEAICHRMEYQKFRFMPRGPHQFFDALTYKIGTLSAKWQASIGYFEAVRIIGDRLKTLESA